MAGLSIRDHKTRHQNSGDDEISVAGLSGTLADDQHVIDSEALAAAEAGAVSVATANKLVKRDAQGQAAFAAPGAAGEALIKGTRVTIAELPALIDEKIWVGTGGNVEERDVPSARTFHPLIPAAFSECAEASTWEDWDLSAICPEGAYTVEVLVAIRVNGNATVGVRKDISEGDRFMALHGDNAVNIYPFTITCLLTAARHIERYAGGSAGYGEFSIVGYWI